MKTGIAGQALAAMLLFLLASNVSHAQSQSYWIRVTDDVPLAESRDVALNLADEVDGVAVFRGSDGYVVAIGELSLDNAQELLRNLSSSGKISPGSTIVTLAEEVKPLARFPGPAAVTAELDDLAFDFDAGERLAIQIALKWFGFYEGTIDGLFLGETKRAIADFQDSVDAAPTGVITRTQAGNLMNAYNSEIENVQLETVTLDDAGISLAIPAAILKFSYTKTPYVHFEPISNIPATLVLYSLRGDSAVLRLLHDAILASDFVPSMENEQFSNDRFEVTATSEFLSSYTLVQMWDDRIKGFSLAWRPANDELMQRISRGMASSLAESSTITLEDSSSNTTQPVVPERNPKPISTSSGFFVDGSGFVATSSHSVAGCSNVVVGPDFKMELHSLDEGAGLAILRPTEHLVPMGFSRFSDMSVTGPADVSVSGYSHGGLLGAPTLSRGTVIAGSSPEAEGHSKTFIRVAAHSGDIGGPVLDSFGSVIGMLKHHESPFMQLPEGIHEMIKSTAIVESLEKLEIDLEVSESRSELHPVDLGRRAAEMTVLVKCF